MTEGTVFTKGTPIAYNTGFFEKDFLDPSSLCLKSNMLVKTVLWESSQTHEDSSSISKDLSAKMSTKTTKVKNITVDFKQNILNIVKVGQSLHPNDLYCIIEDAVTSTTDHFDEASLAILRKLSKQTPYSKYEGTVDRIEVFYNGDKEDMSSSLRTIADTSDKLLKDKAVATNSIVVTGRVNDDYRVEGTPLSLDKAVINIYVTISTKAGVGDYFHSPTK